MKKSIKIIWDLIEKIVYWLLQKGFRLIKKDLADDVFNNVMQFIKFGLIGVSNTIISYVLYAGSLLIFYEFELFKGIDYYISQVIAFVLSVAWSFYWNNKLVFQLEDGENRSLWKSLLKTYVSYSFTGLFLNSILLALWIEVFHISEFVAPIINLLVSVPINFIINKFWAFKGN